MMKRRMLVTLRCAEAEPSNVLFILLSTHRFREHDSCLLLELTCFFACDHCELKTDSSQVRVAFEPINSSIRDGVGNQLQFNQRFNLGDLFHTIIVNFASQTFQTIQNGSRNQFSQFLRSEVSSPPLDRKCFQVLQSCQDGKMMSSRFIASKASSRCG